jgi:hypothetical protein
MADKSLIQFDPAPSISSREIVSPSSNRKAIEFRPPGAGRVTLSNDPVTGDGNGYVLAAGQGNIQFRLDTHGDVVQRGWYALYSAGAMPVSWIQTLL